MDLLATTLTDHEKNLDNLIGRLEEISKQLAQISKTTKLEKPAGTAKTPRREEAGETLIYIRLKINRPSEDLKVILDSLKE